MYESSEVEALIESRKDEESLSEIEERLAIAWMNRQLRDGKTLQEIWEEIKRQVGRENDPAN
jgi:hypothetical protein